MTTGPPHLGSRCTALGFLFLVTTSVSVPGVDSASQTSPCGHLWYCIRPNAVKTSASVGDANCCLSLLLAYKSGEVAPCFDCSVIVFFFLPEAVFVPRLSDTFSS